MSVKAKITNEDLAQAVIQTAINCGVEEFCICAASRNAPFIASLATQDFLKCYWGFEERSTAFFALGRIKRTKKPVAVIVTSGTAVAELLPAVMEAYYSCLPLLVITADRPSRFRGKGAPQSCDQYDLFGIYAPYREDLDNCTELGLLSWNQRSPAHVNVCFEEPKDIPGKPLVQVVKHSPFELIGDCAAELDAFLEKSSSPLVIAGEIAVHDRDAAEEFMLRLNAPVICEPPSGLSYRTSLNPLRIKRRHKILETANEHGYPIDGVIRLGGVPTLRLWRDLENRGGEIPVLTLSRQPFSGLSFCDSRAVPLGPFLESYRLQVKIPPKPWMEIEQKYEEQLATFYALYPHAEQTLFHELSKKMPKKSSLYLGNSLPIREWDQFASGHFEDLSIAVNRGLNGIDGQLSTALGFEANWIILGDLTTLYDLAAPWFLSQLEMIPFQIVVVNNGGGQIFSEMYKNPAFLNQHNLKFKAFAEMWGIDYVQWSSIPADVTSDNSRVIELAPDLQQTKEFNNDLMRRYLNS